MPLFQCTLCAAHISIATISLSICQACYDDIQQLQNQYGCLACGAPDSDGHCANCLKQPPVFDKIIAPYIYNPPLDNLIIKFKYHRQWQLAQTLAKLIPRFPKCDLTIPVPLHGQRIKERGFNQSHEILKQLSVDSHPHIIKRIKNTSPQAQISTRKKRYLNIKNCFQVDQTWQATQTLESKSVLVFDDVMTSGATLNEIALTLKKAGATHVTVACIARAAV